MLNRIAQDLSAAVMLTPLPGRYLKAGNASAAAVASFLSSICCDLSVDSSCSSAWIFSSTLCALADAAVTSIAASTTLDVTPQDLFFTCSSNSFKFSSSADHRQVK